MSGILSGPEIRRRVEAGSIRIDPFDPAMLNGASIDLTLGGVVFTYTDGIHALDPDDPPGGHREEHPPGAKILIAPGRLYLMHTAERVWARDLVPVLDGKSSRGRVGISVHQTAGYGDPGFDGQYTLEVTSMLRVQLTVGMRIAQMRFHTLVGEVVPYAGKYVGDWAMGAIPARPTT